MDPKDVILLTQAEWVGLSAHYIKRLGEITTLDMPVAVVELEDKTQGVVLRRKDIRKLVELGIKKGLKPATPLERQFVAICMQDG